ncbi:TPA: glutathione S-transferase family protein [Vibrio parahaemolyticus]|uniref:glutathione S-transferase family protein n=1 Tax=Vibrio parahaemolyticus TaxID=670 RepID=UPI000FEC9885|nr:glutathione S-transferase family protein [Vibrio parahaemolyticus]MCX8885331.1 glutathione S-transferase family protein [Vibrio parahaemolyticus]HAS3026324.1 glutathione S-transferase family protein [Vibrio parahaemolyticus]HAS3031601.1 glutathione S-transferase family protein [Vibrio parahaemolyticus]HAS3036879.1 glutathione S-transferase family protein [Vibrio parahaemolyticus]HAS3042275.1 glutathione S-transferase family protein [Vibrio parahaemolyticus]
MQLFIGNQNYSSWSLRAWLIFSQYDLKVDVTKLTLFTEDFYDTLASVTPTAKVPTLVDGEITVWDSLAILEYVNEQYLQGKAWPSNVADKAKARAISAEMHSGFFDVRNQLPMNCRARRRVDLNDGALKDIARIDAIWSEQMAQFPDGWLFGDWSIADAMYAPVALRFETYGIELSQGAKAYQQKVLASQAVQKWLAEASQETDIVEEDEAGVEV